MTLRGVPSFHQRVEPSTHPIGSRHRFTSKHNDDRQYSGQPCTVVDHPGIAYPYTVEIDGGPRIYAVNVQLQPLDEQAGAA